MEDFFLMWLSRIDGIGLKRIIMLLKHFKTAENIWNATKSELCTVKGLPDAVIESILSVKNRENLDNWMDELEEKGIVFYSIFHELYPSLLKEIFNPPIGIYVKGVLPCDDYETVAIIGARKCSRYGTKVAYTMAKDLARANICVVSGMARGIDSMAHKGIMDGGGKTIAVLGCGVDICYPAENADLMEEIIENGCVLSEYPPGTPASPYHFPSRNRIISGLSKMVVVVEAGKRSGTLITADLALENGRDVFVVPGNVTSSLSEGTNALIRQGCPIITEGNDILLELGIILNDEERETFEKNVKERLTDDEIVVYDLIPKDESVLAEYICRKLNKNIQEIQYILSLLEIAGYIRRIPQGGYTREG